MKLFKHQEESLKLTENFNRCAYYLDMGLGKTFVGSEKMIRLGSRVNLVICQKSKVQDWEEHFLTQYDENVWTYDLTIKGELEWFLDKVWNDNKIKVGIINYELAWRRPELLKLKDFTLMLDESSLIQNRKAKQTKFIMKLKPTNVILLSGTPCSGKYENLWTQAKLLGWDISEELYNSHYVNWDVIRIGNLRIKQVNKKEPYKNIERLKDKFRSYGSVFMKTEEVFDLPEQTFINVNVPISSEYKRFNKTSYIQIDDEELVGDTSLTKLLYLRELCSIYSQAKIEAFRDLLNSTQDRLIVFYNFTEELNQLVTIAEEMNRPVSIVNGQIKVLDGYVHASDSITFVQYQAGAMGLNLQKANKIVYFSPTLRCEHWMQSQKRIHRIGQNKPCYYYKMICKGSVEEDIYSSLEKGVDYTDKLFERGS